MQITAKEIAGLKHNGKGTMATRYGLGQKRFYLWVYPTGLKVFFYKTKLGEWVKLGELTLWRAWGLILTI